MHVIPVVFGAPFASSEITTCQLRLHDPAAGLG
jgi:hypothetical protein